MKKQILSVVSVVVLLLTSCLDEKEGVRRHRCMDNLVTIGKYCQIYAMKHHGVYPTNISAICNMAELTASKRPALFICPSSGHRAGNMKTVDSWADYTFVPGITIDDPQETILGHCQSGYHRGDGVPILRKDGTTTFVTPETFLHELNKHK